MSTYDTSDYVESVNGRRDKVKLCEGKYSRSLRRPIQYIHRIRALSALYVRGEIVYDLVKDVSERTSYGRRDLTWSALRRISADMLFTFSGLKLWSAIVDNGERSGAHVRDGLTSWRILLCSLAPSTQPRPFPRRRATRGRTTLLWSGSFVSTRSFRL